MRRAWILPFILSTVILFTYQNCGSESTNTLGENAGGLSTVTTDFPFTARANRIAFMSCSAMTPGFNRNVYFSFRAQGVGASGGLGLTKEMADAIKSQGMDSATFRNHILKSPYARSGVQMAIRPEAQLSDAVLITDQNSNAGLQVETAKGFDTFSNTNLLNRLRTSINSRVNMNGSDPFVFDVHYNETINDVGLLKMVAGGNSAYLFLGFGLDFATSASLVNPFRTESGGGITSSNRAVGQGFRFGFGGGFTRYGTRLNTQVSGNNVAPDLERSVTSVVEADLMSQTGRPAANSNWQCGNPLLNFRIVPPSEIGNTNRTLQYREPGINCRPYAEVAPNPEAGLTTQQVDAFRIADAILNPRRALGEVNWVLDMVSRCAYPADGSDRACYSGASTVQTLDWQDDSSCATNAGLTCPHWISICTAN